MANGYGIYDISGSMMATHSSSLYAAMFLSGNTNQKDAPFRKKVKRLLMGEATRADFGEAPDKADGQSNIGSYDQQLATRPSWTQAQIGLNHAYVMPTLSSSTHEVSRLNAFASGNFALEVTAVPASSTIFYQKGNRFRKLYYKLSASAGMTPEPANETSPSTVERLGRTTWEATSGSYRNNSYHEPAQFKINIPEYGRIRDVRVWVEFIHDIRGGAGTLQSADFNKGGGGSATPHREHGLQGVQIALRSPNVSFRSAHPLWNDTHLSAIGKDGSIPGLLKNSYLLWAGHACEKDLSGSLGSLTSSFVAADDNRSLDLPVFSGAFTPGGFRDKCMTVASFPSNTGPNRGVFGGPMFATVQQYDGLGYGNTRLTLTSILTGSVTRYFTWQQVDTVAAPSEQSSIGFRYDSRGNKHVLYASSSFGVVGYDLVYARLTGTSWEKETLFSFSSETVTSWDLVLDQNELPNVVFNNISYSGQGASIVFFSRKNSDGTWSRENVSAKDTGKYVKIDYDRVRGMPVIGATTFGTNLTPSIFVFRSGTNGWTSEVALTASSTTAVNHPWVIVDSAGSTHVAGLAVASGRGTRIVPLYYKSSSIGGWREAGPSITSSLSDTHNGLYFALDRNENPSFTWSSFQSNTNSKNGARLARSDHAGWTVTTMFTGSTIQETGLGFDEGNNAVVLAGAFDSFGVIGWGHLSYENTRLSTSLYNEYDTDIDMRTIFTDASPVPNPRNLSSVHPNATLFSPGVGLSRREMLNVGAYPSPSSASISRGYNAIGERLQMTEPAVLTGANYPWMHDTRVFPGRLTGFASAPSGSVPPEWYTGLAGEFVTAGEQLGPATIQPVYPLLDDVYVEKLVDFPTSSNLQVRRNSSKIIGFRPGLRGTEVHGTWTLLIGTEANDSLAHSRAGIWFRNFRLEFLIDEGPEHQDFMPSRGRKFKRPTYVSHKEGKKLLGVMSGSSMWDVGTNVVYSEVPAEYGRSVGITDEPEAGLDTFAVFSRITGTLADRLSESDPGVFNTYLKNEFGTPYIPVSSGSGENPSFDPYTPAERSLSKLVLQDVLGQKSKLKSANTLKSVINRSNYVKSIRDVVSTRLASGSQGS